MSQTTIRLAVENDAEEVAAIYGPVVTHTPISFEWQPPTADEMRSRIVATRTAQLPWIVLERDGRVMGYAYAGRHRGERAAYRWSVESSLYIHPDARRTGVGRALYTSLFALLTAQGFVNVYAGATLPNEGSVGLHAAMGFREVGVYRNVGFKFDTWHDVIWWYLRLVDHPLAPELPRGLDEAMADGGTAA
ncbi:MAG: arsinothricin resistance N-acetyltransferase ArsN1 family B, partial [bacterium]